MTLTKYDEAMQKIKVTPEMRARILQNAAAQCKPSDQKKPARVTVLHRFCRACRVPGRTAGRVPLRFRV